VRIVGLGRCWTDIVVFLALLRRYSTVCRHLSADFFLDQSICSLFPSSEAGQCLLAVNSHDETVPVDFDRSSAFLNEVWAMGPVELLETALIDYIYLVK
jgi:hypothetical protein